MLDAVAVALEGSALENPRVALSQTLSADLAGRRSCIAEPAQPDLLKISNKRARYYFM